MMWEWVVKLAIRLVLGYLDSEAEKSEAKKKFLEFIDAMETESSMGLVDSYKDQIEKLKKH